MPRTKASSNPYKNVTLTVDQKLQVNLLLAKWETQYEKLMRDLQDERTKLVNSIKGLKLVAKQNYPSSIRNKTVGELKSAMAGNSTLFESISASAMSICNKMSSTQKSNTDVSCMNMTKPIKSIKKTKLKKRQNSDEAESQRTLSNDRRRVRSPVPNHYKARRSRSLSRTKVPKNVTIQLPSPREKRGTPERRMPPPGTYGAVTPKVKPNTPLTVLRRPKQGEMAISMQGSPLLINGIVTEACANVNIPLEDGRILSLQPSRNIRVSQIPVIPDNTRLQLEKLRDHLNVVCEYSK